MTTYQPTIDIVVTAYNDEHSIGKCLQALKDQGYPADLVNIYVVIDSCTTDDTANVATYHDANITVAEGTGSAFIRNLGFAQGASELIGFLDANCVPESGWISAMVAPFEDPLVGGCQSSLQSSCDNPLVQRLVDHSFHSSDQRLLEHTVEGRFSAYPWLLGSSSMFRRNAVEDAEPSSHSLTDDVDRSWKVFLEGHQLVNVAGAKAVQYERASIGAYLKKVFNFGVGAAQLAYAYGHAPRRIRRDMRYPRTIEVTLLDLIYGAGYLTEEVRQRRGKIALPRRNREPVQRRFRPRFTWSEDAVVQISPSVVFWPVGDECIICVNLLSGARVVFDNVANLVFRLLIGGADRSQTCAAVVEQFPADPSQVETDVDQFIEQLRQEGVLNVLARSSSIAPESELAIAV